MRFSRKRRQFLQWLTCILCATVMGGCAALPPNSFVDPTAVGQFPLEFKENGIRSVLTPRDTPPGIPNAVEPTAEDLVADFEDYRLIGGDSVLVQIEELTTTGAQYSAQLEINPAGFLRLPMLGNVKLAGLTEEEAEREVSSRLIEADILPDPLVQLVTVNRRGRQFSILGSVAAAGPYPITMPDFRLLDAISLARGLGAEVSRLYIIRRPRETANGFLREIDAPTGRGGLVIPPPDEDTSQGDLFSTEYFAQSTPPANNDPNTLREIDALFNEAKVDEPMIEEPERPKPLIFDSLADTEPNRADDTPAPRTSDPPTPEAMDWDDVPELELEQRVIEIDVKALRNGDHRYNVVVRNRDVIQVPVDTGIFYMMGEVSRPGVYAFGGREITLKQAVAMTGGLSPLAWPQRVEIIRREQGTDKQLTIPVNLDAIFAGLEEDVFLRADDIVNVGTHFIAPFLFVVRNSFRFTYGFGFVYDRNFADKDSFGARLNPEIRRQQQRATRGLPF